jgi:hypothetical protein
VHAFNNPASTSTREERFLAYKGAIERIIGNSGILLPPTPIEEGIPHSQENTNGSSTIEGVKDPSQESSSASIIDKNAKVLPAQKSAKAVFFEENAKGSPPKWGNDDDEEMQNAHLWNYNAASKDNASPSAAMSAEKSNNGSPSGKDEKDPNSAESQLLKGVNSFDATPEAAGNFKAFLKDKLQERQHLLSQSPSGSPGHGNLLGSPREDPGDEVMQVDAQGNNLTIPQDLAEQIDAIQEEKINPESLLLQEMYSRHLREDVRVNTQSCGTKPLKYAVTKSIGGCHVLLHTKMKKKSIKYTS